MVGLAVCLVFEFGGCDMLWLLRVLAFWDFRYLLMTVVYLICVIWLFSCCGCLLLAFPGLYGVVCGASVDLGWFIRDDVVRVDFICVC